MIFKNRPKVLGSFEILAAAIPLALTILMIHLSYRQFVYSLEVNPRTIHLFLPLVYARLSLLVGFVFMALYFARELVAAIRGLIQGVPVKVILGSEQ
jgi:TRAP-type C4-dicarboxylate transport system permease small subunit